MAALASQVATLEAALAKETSEKESAQDALASLNDKLTTLQGQLNSVQSADKAQGPEAADGTSSL